MNRTIDISTFKGLNYAENEIAICYQYLTEVRQFLNLTFEHINYHFIYDRCVRLFSSIPICCVEVTEHAVMRARRNYNGELFSHQYEISYFKQCPNPLTLGRFNRPKESLFYGSLPLISNNASFTATAIAECCKDLFDDKNSDNSFDFTLGFWKVKPFIAICLCLEDKHLHQNKRMHRVTSDFCNNIIKQCNRLTSTLILECWQFLSNLSTTKDPRAYLILAAWFCAIKTIYQENEFEINGIIYPSSATDSSGLNIVLPPDAVDNYLYLESATMFKAERWASDHKHFDFYPITKITQVKHRRFYFTDFSDIRRNSVS
jgi:hypothetical protein